MLFHNDNLGIKLEPEYACRKSSCLKNHEILKGKMKNQEAGLHEMSFLSQHTVNHLRCACKDHCWAVSGSALFSPGVLIPQMP
jgi:hypothetical protein